MDPLNLFDPVVLIYDQSLFFGVIIEITSTENTEGRKTDYKVEFLRGGEAALTTANRDELHELRRFIHQTISETEKFFLGFEGVTHALARSERLLKEKKDRETPPTPVPVAIVAPITSEIAVTATAPTAPPAGSVNLDEDVPF